MTENQLKYLAYQESMRHNLAAEGNDANRNAETARSNLANEGLKQQSVDETKRSNMRNEELKEESLSIDERTLQQKKWKDKQDVLRDAARLQEDQRHNKRTENAADVGNLVNLAKVPADYIKATAQAAKLLGSFE